MYKKISFIALLFGIMLLSGCHPCDNRDISEEALTVFATEYEFEDYIIEYSSWDEIEVMGEHITGENCSVVKEHTGRKLVDNTGNTIRILYVSACEEDDVYLYEGLFPSFERINLELDLYNNRTFSSTTIDVITELTDPLESRFHFMSNYTGIERDYPIGYLVGTMIVTEDDIEEVKDVWVIQISENSFGFVRLIYQEDGYLFLVLNSFEVE